MFVVVVVVVAVVVVVVVAVQWFVFLLWVNGVFRLWLELCV